MGNLNVEDLCRYKNPYYFKRHETYEDFLNEQLAFHVQNPDLEDLKARLLDLDSDFIIMRINTCSTNSIDFYARYLFYTKERPFLLQGIKSLTTRFNKEEDKDNKLKIYNIIRPLINLLTVEEVLTEEFTGELSILVGEWARKHDEQLERVLGNRNIPQKVMGYYSGDLEEVRKFIKVDVNVLEVLTWLNSDHEKVMGDLVDSDYYLQFYLTHCNVDKDFLGKLKGRTSYNSYTLFLLMQEEGQQKLLKEEGKEEQILDIMILSNLSSPFSSPLLGRDSVKTLLDPFKKPSSKSYAEIREEILKDEYLGLSDPIDINCKEKEFVYKLETAHPSFKALERIKEGIFFGSPDLQVIRRQLVENYSLVELLAWLEKTEEVSLENWLDSKEVFFSQMVERSPVLKDFHKSGLLNKKKRSQMAKEILESPHKDLFLTYLDKRGVYVDLRPNSVEHDFSVKWLKLFIEENSKTLRIKRGDSVKIHFKEEETILEVDDKKLEFLKKGNKIAENQKKIEENQKKIAENQKKIDPIPKRTKPTIPVNEEDKDKDKVMLRKIMQGEEKGKPLPGFKKFGLLNQFISENVQDLEGCARVASFVILNQSQFDEFLRTWTFVLEDEDSQSEFLYHFLRMCQFPIKMSSLVSKRVESFAPIKMSSLLSKRGESFLFVLAFKVDVSDLNFLITDSFSEDLSLGLLLRSYSYFLSLNKGKGEAGKIKVKGDGKDSLTFYYKLGDVLELKYKSTVLTALPSKDEEVLSYLNLMKEWALSGSTQKEVLYKKNLEILKKIKPEEGKMDKIEEEDKIENKEEDEENGEKEFIDKDEILQGFLRDPKEFLPFLSKLVEGGHAIPKPVAFEALKFLKEVRGDSEFMLLDILKASPRDLEVSLFALSCYESFSVSSKIKILDLIFKTPLDLSDPKFFIKLCEVVGNEDNLQVLKVLLVNLRDKFQKKVYSQMIESWKGKSKLSKLLLRIYPLSYEDKEFYSEIFKGCKFEDEKEVLREVYELREL